MSTPQRPTLADSIAAAIMAGVPGAFGWDDAETTYVVVTDVPGTIMVDARPGGTAETVRQFAQRVEGGTVRHAVAALASAKADALRADGQESEAATFETWARELREDPQP